MRRVQISHQNQNWPPRIDELQREMERFLSHVHRGKRPGVVFSERAWAPNVDMYETSAEVVVLVDLAGVPRERIGIEVEGDHLRLYGERRMLHHGQERIMHALEVPYGPFERLIHLPFPVDGACTQAAYHDGFLEISLPRLLPQAPRRIPIQTTENTDA